MIDTPFLVYVLVASFQGQSLWDNLFFQVATVPHHNVAKEDYVQSVNGAGFVPRPPLPT